MTPKRPIEVALASRACGEAWLRRDQMVDAGDEVGVQAMNQACEILGGHYNSLWEKWQNMGGTSDIESLALHEVELDGTEPSPIISGGEVLYRNYNGNDEIPF